MEEITTNRLGKEIMPYVICLVIAILFFSSGYIYASKISDKQLRVDNLAVDDINTLNQALSTHDKWVYGQLRSIDDGSLIVYDRDNDNELKLSLAEDVKFLEIKTEGNETIKEPVLADVLVGEEVSILIKGLLAIEVNYEANPHLGE